ncbi:hypothetical protein MPER_05244 [Moniliophthora perniciosa FA553]|nr:hypothetical protein MPER_05244 [Moniliophthora perniciosa FA553]
MSNQRSSTPESSSGEPIPKPKPLRLFPSREKRLWDPKRREFYTDPHTVDNPSPEMIRTFEERQREKQERLQHARVKAAKMEAIRRRLEAQRKEEEEEEAYASAHPYGLEF